MIEIKSCPFAIGDVVYIFGKYSYDIDAPVYVIKAKIDHVRNRKFVAYSLEDYSEWHFSTADYNKSVFKSKTEANLALCKRKRKE